MEALGLFTWKSSVSLSTTSGSIEVYLRTLGGVEDEQRTDAALAASMKARSELDKKSQLYENHIAPLLSLNRDGLKEVILSLQRGLFLREARWRVEPYGDPDAPEEMLAGTDIIKKPDLDDILNWKDQQNSLRGELEKRRTEWVTQQMEALKKELAKLKIGQLRDRAIDLHKAAIIERAYNRDWDYHTLFYGCFKDAKCKKPFFESVQEIKDLPRFTRMQLEMAYLELDTFSRNPELLKNSS